MSRASRRAARYRKPNAFAQIDMLEAPSAAQKASRPVKGEDPAVPHVKRFSDGYRVWNPMIRGYVGDERMQPFADPEVARVLQRAITVEMANAGMGGKRLAGKAQKMAEEADLFAPKAAPRTVGEQVGFKFNGRTAKGAPTQTNIYAMMEHFAGRKTAPTRMPPTDLPHLKRCLAAGLCETHGNQLVLTPSGEQAIADYRAAHGGYLGETPRTPVAAPSPPPGRPPVDDSLRYLRGSLYPTTPESVIVAYSKVLDAWSNAGVSPQGQQQSIDDIAVQFASEAEAQRALGFVPGVVRATRNGRRVHLVFGQKTAYERGSQTGFKFNGRTWRTRGDGWWFSGPYAINLELRPAGSHGRVMGTFVLYSKGSEVSRHKLLPDAQGAVSGSEGEQAGFKANPFVVADRKGRAVHPAVFDSRTEAGQARRYLEASEGEGGLRVRASTAAEDAAGGRKRNAYTGPMPIIYRVTGETAKGAELLIVSHDPAGAIEATARLGLGDRRVATPAVSITPEEAERAGWTSARLNVPRNASATIGRWAKALGVPVVDTARKHNGASSVRTFGELSFDEQGAALRWLDETFAYLNARLSASLKRATHAPVVDRQIKTGAANGITQFVLRYPDGSTYYVGIRRQVAANVPPMILAWRGRIGSEPTAMDAHLGERGADVLKRIVAEVAADTSGRPHAAIVMREAARKPNGIDIPLLDPELRRLAAGRSIMATEVSGPGGRRLVQVVLDREHLGDFGSPGAAKAALLQRLRSAKSNHSHRSYAPPPRPYYADTYAIGRPVYADEARPARSQRQRDDDEAISMLKPNGAAAAGYSAFKPRVSKTSSGVVTLVWDVGGRKYMARHDPAFSGSDGTDTIFYVDNVPVLNAIGPTRHSSGKYGFGDYLPSDEAEADETVYADSDAISPYMPAVARKVLEVTDPPGLGATRQFLAVADAVKALAHSRDKDRLRQLIDYVRTGAEENELAQLREAIQRVASASEASPRMKKLAKTALAGLAPKSNGAKRSRPAGFEQPEVKRVDGQLRFITRHPPRAWIDLAQEVGTDLPASLFAGSWVGLGMDLPEARDFIVRRGITDPKLALRQRGQRG